MHQQWTTDQLGSVARAMERAAEQTGNSRGRIGSFFVSIDDVYRILWQLEQAGFALVQIEDLKTPLTVASITDEFCIDLYHHLWDGTILEHPENSDSTAHAMSDRNVGILLAHHLREALKLEIQTGSQNVEKPKEEHPEKYLG